MLTVLLVYILNLVTKTDQQFFCFLRLLLTPFSLAIISNIYSHFELNIPKSPCITHSQRRLPETFFFQFSVSVRVCLAGYLLEIKIYWRKWRRAGWTILQRILEHTWPHRVVWCFGKIYLCFNQSYMWAVLERPFLWARWFSVVETNADTQMTAINTSLKAD